MTEKEYDCIYHKMDGKRPAKFNATEFVWEKKDVVKNTSSVESVLAERNNREAEDGETRGEKIVYANWKFDHLNAGSSKIIKNDFFFFRFAAKKSICQQIDFRFV